MSRTPFFDAQNKDGALFENRGGWELAVDYGEAAQECRSVRSGVGLLDRSARARLEVSGSDRYSWLQGMVTNDVRLLEGGDKAISACILDATGHLLADMAIVRRSDNLILDLNWENRRKVIEVLDRYIIMEDVEIVDQSEFLACLSVQGPKANDISEMLSLELEWTVCPSDHTGEGGFDIYLKADESAELWGKLVEYGIQPVGEIAAEILRIEAGIPRYSVDMDETNIPLECNLEATHISHDKGCYVGQEIIARIHSRGHTNRALTGFFHDGRDGPANGERILSHIDGEHRDIGWITSVTYSPTLDRPIAIGYLRHEYREPGTVVATESGLELTVTSLPFVPRQP
jgi:folate-binding protein YgfZ